VAVGLELQIPAPNPNIRNVERQPTLSIAA
jgi:hypothetical protein